MDPIIRIEHVNKSFGVIKALKDVSLDVMPGETLALVGENGAGKSTLMKILTGAYQTDEGRILVDGREVHFNSPAAAKRLGIAQAYQRAELISEMTVAENVLLGEREFSRRGLVDKRAMFTEVSKLMEKYSIPVRADDVAGRLSGAMRQMVAIAKVLYSKPRVVILDEPTAVLSDVEVRRLFAIIEELKREKRTILYISHRLEEIFQIADRVAILRDGAMVTVLDNKGLTKQDIVGHMLGREMNEVRRAVGGTRGEAALELDGVTTAKVRNISFTLHRGEILGVAGLVGSGRTEMARAVYGLDKILSGSIKVNGAPAVIRRPTDAVRRGIFLAPEDRKREAMVLCLSIRENVSLASLKRISRQGIVSRRKERIAVDALCKGLGVKADSIETPVQNLSGGNQQKIVVAKAITARPDILIFDEPTQGIDVGAKAEIYQLLGKLRGEGKAILMISSEIEEIQRVCDRALILCGGALTGEVSFDELDDTQKILSCMYGGTGQ